MKIERFKENLGERYYDQLPTLAEALAEILGFFSIRHIYGVGGDYAAPLMMALEKKFSLHPSSNEMHAAFSACSEAELSGISVCLVTYTVGSLPCISAAALAKSEHLPVVFLSGAPGEDEVQNGFLHHSIHSGYSWKSDYDGALKAFDAIGVRGERLQGSRNASQPSIAAERVFELVRYAYAQKEPVFIEIPRNLVWERVQSISLPKTLSAIESNPILLNGSDLIVHSIVEKLKSSRRPLLFLGEKIKRQPKLQEVILSFSQSRGIPIATNIFGKGVFDEFNPLNLGIYNGIFSAPETRTYIETAVDYILEIGTSICDLDTATAFGTGTFAIEHFPNKTTLKGSEPAARDLVELMEALHQSSEIPVFDVELPRKNEATWRKEEPVSFANIATVLNHEQNQTNRAFVYLPEIGNSFFASLDLCGKKSKLGRNWLSNPWYAAMGTSIPYARPVAQKIKDMGSDDVPVILTGDGGFHFQQNELIHFFIEQLFAVILLMRNDIFHLGKSSENPMYHCSDSRFDFQSLIRCYGGTYAHCPDISSFQKAFRAGCESGKGLHLLEIPVSIEDSQQSAHIQRLNLYIQAKAGNEDARRSWDGLCRKV